MYNIRIKTQKERKLPQIYLQKKKVADSQKNQLELQICFFL